MIIQFLNKIIKKYIEHFNVLNNSDHAEYMKWEAAYAFQHFDFESPDDFAGRLKELCKICSVVIDNKASFPLGCLCSCASIDDEKANRVRKMFLDLFVDDKNDLQVRQSKIDTFIRESDALRSECGKNGYMYANTQTSVMAYLALRDPENNYLLSTSKARELASRIGFGDDWGTLSSFKLDVYYRFCDQLVDAMKKNQDLMDINKTRYQEEFCDGNHSPFHEDKELHLLAFDIIYTAASDTYGLGEEIPVDPDIVKKYEKAKVKYQEYLEANDQMESLLELKEKIESTASEGCRIRHKSLGDGCIKSLSKGASGNCIVQLSFDNSEADSKKFDLYTLLSGRIITIEGLENLDIVLLKRAKQIEARFSWLNHKFCGI